MEQTPDYFTRCIVQHLCESDQSVRSIARQIGFPEGTLGALARGGVHSVSAPLLDALWDHVFIDPRPRTIYDV